MSQYIGALHNISTARAMLDLYLYDDGIVVGRGSIEGAFLRTALRATGDRIATEREQQRTDTAGPSRDALLGANANNRLIALSAIAAARFTKHLLGDRLLLELADGTTEKFEWKRRYNDHAEAERMLRTALGSKLVV